MTLRRIHRHVLTWAVVIGSTAIARCGGGGQPASERSAGTVTTPSTASAPAATDKPDGPGVISGAVTLDGTAPPPRPLRTDSDPLCKPQPGAMTEGLLVSADKGIQNVFVYVKDGLGSRSYAVPTEPVLLDQRGCQYVPHVFGVQVGQTLRIANSDPALHNVNASPKENRAFNFGQPSGVPPATRVFDKPEVGLPLRCDVHNWMNAYAGVVAHPFFAVTTSNGHFEIKGLPEGSYTLEAWHERLGTETQNVTVDGKTPAKVSFTFKSST
jgi:hypothetical protein